MKLCVGATSRRVVEEAASLGVHQIVASNAQVNDRGGYTGLTPRELVDIVRELSGGRTAVVRDHGGPYQYPAGYEDTDYVRDLHGDIDAGFNGLHLDVCKMPRDEQTGYLKFMLTEFDGAGVTLEIGGEHETSEWNLELLTTALDVGVSPDYVVLGFGSYVWADRQCGRPVSPEELRTFSDLVSKMTGGDTRTKIHNADWVGRRRERYADSVDAYNIAPELGCLEVDLILATMLPSVAATILENGYAAGTWRRWFYDDEGTWFDRAKCGVRYGMGRPGPIMSDIEEWLNHDEVAAKFVRDGIRNALEVG